MERTCPFCGLTLTSGGRHIYTCGKSRELTKEEIKLIYIKHVFGDNIVDEVCDDYLNLYSLPMLRDKYGTDFKTILFILDYKGIEKRSLKESSDLISKEKYKKTVEAKYGRGITNISQVQDVKDKKKRTFTNHYGVDNIWKLSEYNRKCAEQYPESHKEHLRKLYEGRDKFWNSASDEDIAALVKKASDTRQLNGMYSSSLETRFCRILNELDISYTRQFHLKHDRHPYDFFLCGSKIIIEINGNYWHANHKYYKEDDVIKYLGKSISAKEIWERDKRHIDKAENMGYKVLVFWEDDFKCDDNRLKELILQSINQL